MVAKAKSHRKVGMTNSDSTGLMNKQFYRIQETVCQRDLDSNHIKASIITMQNPWLVNHDRYEPADRPYTSPKDVLSYGSVPSCPSQTEPSKVDVTRPAIMVSKAVMASLCSHLTVLTIANTHMN